ncbi:MAG: hypothetical protein HYS13_13415 [Planctomycetia bacterium]|nr:hypothetical protein [Planctomycetia bacterium]
MRQRSLLPDNEVTFTSRSVKAVTFQGKLSRPIHRWYRLTPSFSPILAEDIARHFGLTEDDHVLDPFSGVGTVPLCMKYRRIGASSIEVNPYLHFVSAVKTRTYTDIEEIADCLGSFVREYRSFNRAPKDAADAQRLLREHEAFIPPIHKPLRWWSEGNLAQLACLRRLLLAYQAEPQHLDLLRMGVLGILVPVSNAKHNHVSLTFDDNPRPTVNIANVIAAKYREMTEDLRSVCAQTCSEVRVYHGNSKAASAVLHGGPKASAVITSPPYPNRFSYARETRPHLFFLNFVKNAEAVGQLETDSIGGTWGKATSVLAEGVAPLNRVVDSLLAPYTARFNGSGELMANYVTKYFNDMYSHAAEIDKVCRSKARLAYVIGNSKFYGHPLPSDEILAAIFAEFGFRLDGIDRMRKRQSKSGLYEAVVFLSR